jgi:anti-sigma factor RsiW
MSRTLDEQLSAALDGELPADQYDLLLRRLDADPELRDIFARFSMIGDVMANSQPETGALALADRIREELAGIEAPEGVADRDASGSSSIVGGMLGAGFAAAVALVLALNLSPQQNDTPTPRVAGGTPLPVAAAVATDQRANVGPERMTRYLIAHAGYANPASRQFVDSHIVMPAFQRATWQTSGSRR